MSTAKVAITLEKETLKELDRLVRKGVFPNRSIAIQMTLAEKLIVFNREKFELECQKLDSEEERNLSNENFKANSRWPDY